jgi:hypothetical protein
LGGDIVTVERADSRQTGIRDEKYISVRKAATEMAPLRIRRNPSVTLLTQNMAATDKDHMKKVSIAV